MSTTAVLRPNLKWAQRDEHVWLTVDLSGVEDMKVDLKPTTLKFSGVSHGDKYAFDITFYAEIVPEESKYSQKRLVEFCLKKKAADEWPRLTSEKIRASWIQIDWSRWDDGEASEQPGGNAFDMAGMQDFMGQMGQGMDAPDSDDESDADDLPDLDEPVATEEEQKKVAAPEGDDKENDKKAGIAVNEGLSLVVVPSMRDRSGSYRLASAEGGSSKPTRKELDEEAERAFEARRMSSILMKEALGDERGDDRQFRYAVYIVTLGTLTACIIGITYWNTPAARLGRRELVGGSGSSGQPVGGYRSIVYLALTVVAIVGLFLLVPVLAAKTRLSSTLTPSKPFLSYYHCSFILAVPALALTGLGYGRLMGMGEMVGELYDGVSISVSQLDTQQPAYGSYVHATDGFVAANLSKSIVRTLRKKPVLPWDTMYEAPSLGKDADGLPISFTDEGSISLDRISDRGRIEEIDPSVNSTSLCAEVTWPPPEDAKQEIFRRFREDGWEFSEDRGYPENAPPDIWLDVSERECVSYPQGCEKRYKLLGIIGILFTTFAALSIVVPCLMDWYMDMLLDTIISEHQEQEAELKEEELRRSQRREAQARAVIAAEVIGEQQQHHYTGGSAVI
ncbi:Prostaglandin E synthase 3 (Cytosolic) [Perkinsus chesapeaki]|uniref:Prostaglandin E synthase 3 (Cytosolic) n=1 Tax=Perkinsus chesapeaki TaxID=330153 RepID=A0A7J6N0L1_PERCH|nr:Prostaglandin E synthase 3 (Cytosolic) [Perkinsus chesapeaki]